MGEPGQSPLDALTLAAQQLARVLGIHGATLAEPRRAPLADRR
jgi:hypothetical protein